MASERTTNFIRYLVSLSPNKGIMAELRKCVNPSRTFEAGKYIYKFLPEDKWGMRCFVGVAALFAMHSYHTEACPFGASLGKALGYDDAKAKRVINFLKAKDESVFVHLRHLISMTKKSPINWIDLLNCLWGWDSDRTPHWAQNKIAKDFWMSQESPEPSRSV